MAYDPTIPALNNYVADDIPKIMANFAELAGSRIVEMGSNSNGEYVRWENGLQVCWLYGVTGSAPLDIQPEGTGTFRWVYPAQFSIVPIVIGSPTQPLSFGGGRIVVIGARSDDISTVSVDGYRYNTESENNVNGSLSLLAIGRWK